MAIIRVHSPSEYVTLINLFTVAPRDQLGLARVQLGDMYWYGRQQPGAISANFHSSRDGERFFNYGQWRSREELERSSQSEAFQSHLANYRYFDLSYDPHVYEVVYTTEGRSLEIRWPSPVTTTLRMLKVRPEDQAAVLALVREELERLSSARGLIGAALHRSLDGERVAVYAQWRDLASLFVPAVFDLERRLEGLAPENDFRTYEVVGTTGD